MAKNKLTVKGLQKLEPGNHGDGGGLWFRKNSETSQQWVFRYTFAGKPAQLGLGSYPAVSLAKARTIRDEWAEFVRLGKNPTILKKQFAAHARSESDSASLRVIAEKTFDSKKASLRGNGKAGRWFGPLQNHILPTLGDRSIESITQGDIYEVLRLLWNSKPDVAQKAIGRLKQVLEYAENMDLNVNVDVIRKAKGLLGRQVPSTGHIPHLPWQAVPDFYAKLSGGSLTELGLRFLILNPGPRTKPIRFMRLEHIQANMWVVPGELMKADVTLPKWSKICVSILADFKGEIRHEEETIFHRADCRCTQAGGDGDAGCGPNPATWDY